MTIKAIGVEPYNDIVKHLRQRLRAQIAQLRDPNSEISVADALTAEEILWDAITETMEFEEALRWYEEVCSERWMDED